MGYSLVLSTGNRTPEPLTEDGTKLKIKIKVFKTLILIGETDDGNGSVSPKLSAPSGERTSNRYSKRLEIIRTRRSRRYAGWKTGTARSYANLQKNLI